MVIKDNKKVPQTTIDESPLYVCEKCHYNTCDRSNWTKHKRTTKHKKLHMVTDGNNIVPQTTTNYTCVCGKSYNYMSGLSRHKKSCTYKPTKDSDSQEMTPIVIELLKKMDEQQKIISDLVKRAGNNNNNNNTNIIVQLNNNYPNAIPIQDLCSKIKALPQCVTHNPMLLANTIADLLGHQSDDQKTIRSVKDTMYVKYEETFKEDKEGEVFDTIKKETEQDQLSKASDQTKNMFQREKEAKKYPEMVSGIMKPLTSKDKKRIKNKII
jgi:hypothetical protein